ncbi:hypothetical protein R6Z07F_015637 [Ovis aries]
MCSRHSRCGAAQKRNLPLYAQVSPASSCPGNGGDYLLCISQRAAGSEALGLSSAPSMNRQGRSSLKLVDQEIMPERNPRISFHQSSCSFGKLLTMISDIRGKAIMEGKVPRHIAGTGWLATSSTPHIPEVFGFIKSRETGSQTVAVEGDAATALKQRLPRGAEHRGAGDPDRAAISQSSSPTPKREAHPHSHSAAAPPSRTAEELQAAP